jgi:CHAP domain/Transglycosylase SLT domain
MRDSGYLGGSDREDHQARWLLAPVGLALIFILLTTMLAVLSFVWMRCSGSLQFGPTSGGLAACSMPALPGGNFKPSPKAMQEIPQPVLQYYLAAGKQFDVLWPVLAGIGKEECNHGQSTLPGCHSGANFAGAMGPMQFLQSTWDRYKMPAPGHSAPDVYDSGDAIYSAANYLAHLGASGISDLASPAVARAILGYNHSLTYVNAVLTDARQYSEPAFTPGGANFGPFGQILSTDPLAPLFSWVPKGGFPGIDLFRGAEDQCTWWAAYNWAGRNGRGVTWNGDAGVWLERAVAQGYQASSIPTVGAIVVYLPQSGYSTYGHVAIVSAVGSDHYDVSEQNFKGPGIIDTRRIPWPDPRAGGFLPIPTPIPSAG